MTITYKLFSDIHLLAIYLLIRATKKDANRVVISNDALKSFLHRKRVHSSVISEFADSLKPFFPRNRVATEYYGLKNCLILYLAKGDDKNLPPQREYVTSIPSQEEIDQALPLHVIEIEGQKLTRKWIKR